MRRPLAAVLSSAPMVCPVLLVTPDLIAVDKPAGIVVVPARKEDPAECLWRVLEKELGERLFVVHRLDRDTSGVLLFARTAPAHRLLSMAFEAGQARKTYAALTLGLPPLPEGVIDTPLHPARRGRMRPAVPHEPGALRSATEYRVERAWETMAGTVALVRARPLTGRQHQVRVHLRSAGAPLLVDPIYGRRGRVLGGQLGLPLDAAGKEVALERLTLHALRLEVDCAGLSVEAPLAPDLASLVEALDGRKA